MRAKYKNGLEVKSKNKTKNLIASPHPQNQQPIQSNALTPSAPLTGLVERLDDAIKFGSSIHIAYAGGTNPGPHARMITPVSWTRFGVCVRAKCHNSNPPLEKEFHLLKITRCEIASWNPVVPATTATLLYSVSSQGNYSIYWYYLHVNSTITSATSNDAQVKDESTSIPVSVEEWLEKIKLGKYINHFAGAEFTDLSTLVYLDETALDSMKITALVSRRKLLDEASKVLNKIKQ